MILKYSDSAAVRARLQFYCRMTKLDTKVFPEDGEEDLITTNWVSVAATRRAQCAIAQHLRGKEEFVFSKTLSFVSSAFSKTKTEEGLNFFEGKILKNKFAKVYFSQYWFGFIFINQVSLTLVLILDTNRQVYTIKQAGSYTIRRATS